MAQRSRGKEETGKNLKKKNSKGMKEIGIKESFRSFQA
jgi:hypothetical protein